MTGKEIIVDCCGRIMDVLQLGIFTREDLEFLLKFFRELIEITERKLNA